MMYTEMLYDEFLKTLYSVPNKEIYLKEQFKYWLEEKSRVLPLYVQFLVSFDLTPTKGIVEIDKCEKDSILPYTPYETRGYLVSENTKTQKVDKGIYNVNGRLVLIKEGYTTDIKIKYQNTYIDVNHMRNFATQFPIDEETKILMAELMNTDKNVFIGTYGKLKDRNRDENLQNLYKLKQELSKYLNKNIEGEVVYTREFYLAAISPKIKYKEKSK